MMPALDNPLRKFTATTYDARGYKIDSFEVLASSLEGAEELAALELAEQPPWRAVGYVVMEEA